ncbi:MAG: NADH-quinone oxidoreductase subunit C, partial [Candidatus Hodarchaeota archaeon]
MTSELKELQDDLRNLFDFGVKHQQLISENEILLSGRDEKLLDVMDYLSRKCNARLTNQIVNDYGDRLELIEVLYLNHLKLRMYIKAGIDTRHKSTITAKHIFPSARWLEKYQEFFNGITFVGQEHSEPGETSSDEFVDKLPWISLEVDEFVDKISIMNGPGILDHKLDFQSYTWVKAQNNIVYKAKCQMGNFHRGLVEFAEQNLIKDAPFILSRACWDEKFHILLAYSLALERINNRDNDITFLARGWRALSCEVERLINHHKFLVSWLTLAGETDLAQKNALILNQLKIIENYFIDDGSIPFIKPGGITFDPLTRGSIKLGDLEDKFKGYEADMMEYLFNHFINGNITGQFSGIGCVKQADALKTGLSGPSLRASGMPFDSRADFPYSVFKTGLIRWDVCSCLEGDVQARLHVHLHEMLQSLRIIYQVIYLLEDSPSDDLSVEFANMQREKEGFTVVESSRGELQLYMKT